MDLIPVFIALRLIGLVSKSYFSSNYSIPGIPQVGCRANKHCLFVVVFFTTQNKSGLNVLCSQVKESCFNRFKNITFLRSNHNNIKK